MRPIRYGDVLCFEDSQARGFVRGDPGLTDAVYVDAFPKFDPTAVGKNQMHCCFVIEHARAYSARKAFLRKLRNAQVSEMTWRSQLDPNDSAYVELEELYERFQDEKVTNEVETERVIGTPVEYGSYVQIKHYSSSMILSQSKNRASLNPMALRVFLSEEGSEGSKWKLLPTVKIKGEGEVVHFGDQINLASAKHHSSFLATFMVSRTLKSAGPPSLNINSFASTVRPSGGVERYEVNLAEEASKFRMAIFCNCSPAESPEHKPSKVLSASDPLRALDVVTICHKQFDLFLVADEASGIRWEPRSAAWFDAEHPEPMGMWMILRRALDQGDGVLSVPCAAAVVHHLATGLCLSVKNAQGTPTLSLARPGVSGGLWALVGMAEDGSGQPTPLQDGDFVWMRHDLGHGHLPVWISAPDSSTDQSALESGHHEGQMSARNRQQQQQQQQQQEEAGSEGARACLREAEHGELLDILELSVVAGAAWSAADLVRRGARGLEHVLTAISEAAADGSTCPYAVRGRAVEEWFEQSHLKQALAKVDGVLESSVSALALVCGASMSMVKSLASGTGNAKGQGAVEEMLDGDRLADQPGIVYRRQLLRQFGALTTAHQLVRVCLEEAGIQPSLIARLRPVQELMRVAMGLINVACRGGENWANKRAMAHALPTMQACLVADCGAYGAILSVYSGTREILEGLEDRVFSDTMNSFIETRLPSVLILAIETCRCDGLPIKKNQDRWVKAVFPPPEEDADPDLSWNDQDSPSPVCMDVQVRQDGTVLLFSWAKTVHGQQIALVIPGNTLVRMPDRSPVQDSDRVPPALTPAFVLEYHLAIMQLLTALLRGGNLQTRAALASRAKHLGLQCGQLLAMLANDALPYLFRARCADLLQHLYVDASLKRRLPATLSLIWVWKSLGQLHAADQSSGGHEVLSSSELNLLKKIVVEKLPHSHSAHGYERNEHELHKSLVSLLASLVEAGLYHHADRSHLVVNTDEVSKLVDPLLGLLGNTSEKQGAAAKVQAGNETNSTHQRQRISAEVQLARRRVSVEVKVKALKLLGRLVECCWFCRSAVFMRAWEDILADAFQCSDWAGMLAGMKAAAEHRGEGHKQNLAEQAKRFFGVGHQPLEDYAAVAGLWHSKPPWSQSTVDHLATELFSSHPLMADLSSAKLEALGLRGGGKVNRVIRVVLALVLDEDLTLKERAMQFLFQAFKQRWKVATLLNSSTFICQPSVLSRFSRIRAEIHQLLALSRVIRDAPHSAFELESTANDDSIHHVESLAAVPPERIRRRERSSREEVVNEEWLGAVDRAATILGEWVLAGQATPAGWETSSDEVQRLLSQLEVEPVLASLLCTSLRRQAVSGAYDVPVGEGLKVARMLSRCVRVVSGLCIHSTEQRAWWSGNAEQLWRLVGVQGVEGEEALTALVRNNAGLLNAEGGRWARRYFREVVERCKVCYARGLLFVAALISPQGASSAEVIMAVLRRFKEMEAKQAVLFRGQVGWDKRLALMAADDLSYGGEAGQVRMHLGAVNLLASACLGKNTAAEVYCSHLLPFSDIMRTLRFMHQDSKGKQHELSGVTEFATKHSYLKALYHIYIETSSAELLEQAFSAGNGVWDGGAAHLDLWPKPFNRNGSDGSQKRFDRGPSERPPARGLMEILLADIKLFRSTANTWRGPEKLGKSKEAQTLLALMAYIVEVALPLLPALFQHHRTAQHPMSQHQARFAEAAVQELAELHAQPLRLECSALIVHGQTVHVKDAAKRSLLELLSRLDKPEQALALTEDTKTAERGRVISASVVMRAGLQALVHSVSIPAKAHHSHRVADLRWLELYGSRQLARLFAADETLDLRDYEASSSSMQASRRRKRAKTGHFSYSQVLMSMLAPARGDSGSAASQELFVDLLATLRATLYLSEPADPHLSNDEVEQRWQGYLSDAPMDKKHEPKEAMLEWVQDKYDALGCTEAALRLLGHASPDVHFNAIRLLVALLQGGNRRVQNSVRQLLPSKPGRRALQQLKAIIGRGLKGVAIHKRNIKLLRQAEKFGGSPARGEDEGERGAEQESFSRQAALMFALRLVQLMCEGQYAPLQDRMADRADGSSVLEQCVELFLVIGSTLSEELSTGTGELAVLCVQTVETISECVQGPNRANQQVLLSGDFFSGVNRLLSTVTFSPHKSEEKMQGWMTMNDIKCWLKHAVLGCCIALFEAVRGEAELQNLFKLVHVRNVISQLTSTARVLRLPVASTQPAAEEAEEEDDSARARTSKRSSLLTLNHYVDNSIHALSHRGKSIKDRTYQSWRRIQRAGKGGHWEATFSKGSEKELLEYLLRLQILLGIFKEYCTDPQPRLRIQQFEAEQAELTAFLNTHTSHIECVRQVDGSGGPLAEKVFFSIRPEVARVVRSNDFIHRAAPIIFDVPRENPWEKGREFMKRIKVVNYNLDWYEIVRHRKLLRVCINWRETIDAAPFWVAATITLLLLVVYGLPWDTNSASVFGNGRFYGFQQQPPTYTEEPYPFANETSDPEGLGATYGSAMTQLDLALKYRLSLKNRWDHEVEWTAFEPWGRWTVYGFCIFHVVLSGTSSILHLILDFPLTFLACLEDARVKAGSKNTKAGMPAKGRQLAVTGQEFLDNLPELPTTVEHYSSFAVARAVLRKSRQTLYVALLLIISILGVLSSPFFLVLYLLDAFRGVNGKLVVRSLVVGGPNLLRTFLLAIVVLVCLGFMSYSYFSVVINGVQELCHSPFQCVAIHILDSFTGDLTTVLGDDLGDFAFPAVAVWAGLWETFRTLFVILSIIAWVFLLQGIIQGQIIDAFAEMRDKFQEANADLERKCFVSSVDRFVFQSYPGEWEKRKNGKFAWNYLLYFSHLRHKDPEEYNGMDHFAAKAFDEEQVALLPIGVFVAKQRTEQREKESKMENQMNQVQTQLARMQQQLDTVVAAGMAQDEFSRRFGSGHPSPDTKTTPNPPHQPPAENALQLLLTEPEPTTPHPPRDVERKLQHREYLSLSPFMADLSSPVRGNTPIRENPAPEQTTDNFSMIPPMPTFARADLIFSGESPSEYPPQLRAPRAGATAAVSFASVPPRRQSGAGDGPVDPRAGSGLPEENYQTSEAPFAGVTLSGEFGEC